MVDLSVLDHGVDDGLDTFQRDSSSRTFFFRRTFGFLISHIIVGDIGVTWHLLDAHFGFAPTDIESQVVIVLTAFFKRLT